MKHKRHTYSCFYYPYPVKKVSLWVILRRRESYTANHFPRVLSYPFRRVGERTWERGRVADGEGRGGEWGWPVQCSSPRLTGSLFTGYAFCVAIVWGEIPPPFCLPFGNLPFSFFPCEAMEIADSLYTGKLVTRISILKRLQGFVE